MVQSVEVRVSKDGSNVTINADGFIGKSCEEATADVIARLGETIKQERKPEYFDTETNPISEMR